MNYSPVNRHIRVRVEKEPEDEQLVILPEGYKKEEEPYGLVTVISAAYDTRFVVARGDRILVDKKMIEEIKTKEFGTIYTILDNYVLGIIPKGIKNE